MRLSTIKVAFALLISICTSDLLGQTKYQAPKATTAPTIDGNISDACWSKATWYDVNYLWLGTQPSPTDFSGRFKVCWDANKLYLIAEITDDVLSDTHTEPLDNYWEDDTWEIFMDEDHSGGDHQFNYNAFAYHISQFFDIADNGIDGQAHLFSSHATVARTANGNTYTWEAAFDVYTDQFVYDAASNPKATLTKGKIMGFAMAYCDNDGGSTRESFIGSEDIPGSDKNIAYIDASVFGSLELVDMVTPTFSNVLVTSGIENPTVFTFAPDGRIFVAEQDGKLRIIKEGQLLATPAISVSVNLDGSGGYTENGLLGVALDPNFETNNYVYIFYTTSENGKHNRVSRFTLNGDVAVPGSEQILLELDQTSGYQHNGGALRFGKDGKLYIAAGENHVPSNAQDLNSTGGKVLRINSDGTIPSDNPFDTAQGTKKFVWAYGLRNPYTISTDPLSGKIFVNDVGETEWEEINDVTEGGENFGWPTAEGNSTNPDFTSPVFAYSHTGEADTTGCAITGGCFYNPASTNYPARYIGKYFYMDFCNNWINVFDPNTGKRIETFFKGIAGSPVDLQVSPDGNLYYLSRADGALYKISFSGDPVPQILYQPKSQSIAESQPVTFSVQATGAVPLSYQWQKDGIDIPNATDASFTIPAVAKTDSGKYTVVITNTYGSTTSDAVKLTVTAFNSRPTATITSPANGTLFSGGEVFTVTGSATDAEDGTLPPSALTWKIDLYHNTHYHDGIPQSGMYTFQDTIPTTGETSSNIWYRITLVATDMGGLKDTTYVEIFPRKVDMTFTTNPAGLSITLDGQPLSTPAIVNGVIGIGRTLGAESLQVVSGKAWKFVNWSDGGNQIHSISTPSANHTYTANFEEVPLTNESINTVADAYVQYTSWQTGDMSTTFGTTDPNNLVVKNYANDPDRVIYLTFDLKQVNGNLSNLTSAKIKLYGNMLNEAGITTISIDAHESKNTSWNENTITWDNQPGTGTTILANTTAQDTIPKNYYLDITDYLKSKTLPSDSLISFALSCNTDHMNRVIFNSKESASNIPELMLEYAQVITATAKNTEAKTLSLFPNPATNSVTISFGDIHSSGTLEIKAPSSKTVYTQKINLKKGGNVEKINLKDLKPGIYLVTFQSKGNVYTEKLIIE